MDFILNDNLNQNSIEEFFSKQREAGGHHDNPSAGPFVYHYLRNNVARRSVVTSETAYVKRNEGESSISDEPFPKRKKWAKVVKHPYLLRLSKLFSLSSCLALVEMIAWDLAESKWDLLYLKSGHHTSLRWLRFKVVLSSNWFSVQEFVFLLSMS